jgi:hypothetical protein
MGAAGSGAGRGALGAGAAAGACAPRRRASAVPTGTVCPGETSSSSMTPLWNDSISISALSVSTTATI